MAETFEKKYELSMEFEASIDKDKIKTDLDEISDDLDDAADEIAENYEAMARRIRDARDTVSELPAVTVGGYSPYEETAQIDAYSEKTEEATVKTDRMSTALNTGYGQHSIYSRGMYRSSMSLMMFSSTLMMGTRATEVLTGKNKDLESGVGGLSRIFQTALMPMMLYRTIVFATGKDIAFLRTNMATLTGTMAGLMLLYSGFTEQNKELRTVYIALGSAITAYTAAKWALIIAKKVSNATTVAEIVQTPAVVAARGAKAAASTGEAISAGSAASASTLGAAAPFIIAGIAATVGAILAYTAMAPKAQRGGLVTREGLIYAHPAEIIVPIDKIAPILLSKTEKSSATFGGTTVNATINVTGGNTPTETARQVYFELSKLVEVDKNRGRR